MFIIAMRTLFSFILREMLRLLQKPVMIHLAGLWLATDGRATVDSRLSQLYQKQHVKQLCQQILQKIRLSWASCRSRTLKLGQLALQCQYHNHLVSAHRAVRLKQMLSPS